MHVNEMLIAYYQKAIAERKAIKDKPMKKHPIKKEKTNPVRIKPTIEDIQASVSVTEITEPIFGIGENEKWAASLKKSNPLAYEHLKNWN